MNIVLVVVVVLKLASRHYQLHFLQINTKTLWIFESSCKFIIGVACVVCRLINGKSVHSNFRVHWPNLTLYLMCKSWLAMPTFSVCKTERYQFKLILFRTLGVHYKLPIKSCDRQLRLLTLSTLWWSIIMLTSQTYTQLWHCDCLRMFWGHIIVTLSLSVQEMWLCRKCVFQLQWDGPWPSSPWLWANGKISASHSCNRLLEACDIGQDRTVGGGTCDPLPNVTLTLYLMCKSSEENLSPVVPVQ